MVLKNKYEIMTVFLKIVLITVDIWTMNDLYVDLFRFPLSEVGAITFLK